MNYFYLLKLAKEFKSFEEEYFEKPLTKHDEDEELMLKYNIKPIQTGEMGTSYLGHGENSTAYLALYKGKQVAIKITKSYNDIENLIKLKEISNSVGFLRKHILNVYDIIYDDESKLYLAIVEYLTPLNKHLVDIFKGKNQKAILSVFSIEESCKKIIELLFNKQNINKINIGKKYDKIINYSCDYLSEKIKILIETIQERSLSNDQINKFSMLIATKFVENLINFFLKLK